MQSTTRRIIFLIKVKLAQFLRFITSIKRENFSKVKNSLAKMQFFRSNNGERNTFNKGENLKLLWHMCD